jgi:hypothetical protein
LHRPLASANADHVQAIGQHSLDSARDAAFWKDALCARRRARRRRRPRLLATSPGWDWLGAGCRRLLGLILRGSRLSLPCLPLTVCGLRLALTSLRLARPLGR